MNRYILLGILIAVGIISVVVFSSKAECAWCPSYTCYGPCLGDCVCVTPPGQMGGSCYGVDRADEFRARGYGVDGQESERAR